MKNRFYILLVSICAFTFLHAQNYNSAGFGITLCGAEFGQDNLPGTINTNYTYPLESEITYFANKGIKIIQLPVRWERIQRKLGGPLDKNEMSYITKFIDDCAAKRVQVTLIMQNYGRYKINGIEYVIGSPQVERANYKDVWKKLALTLRDKKNIFALSIMSEPHHMQNYSWFQSAQEAINGIREVDKSHTILVDGDNYSGPETWMQFNDSLKYLADPSDNILYNAHCYFDEDRSGNYKKSYAQSGANEMTGVTRIRPFIQWLQTNKKKGFVGEFGIPNNDNRWLTVFNNFLNYLMNNEVGGCYWAAGPWWKDYPLSIEPAGKVDKPQMNVYKKFLLQRDIKSALAENILKTQTSL